MRHALLALAVLALGNAGCGTVMNLSTPPTPVKDKETGEITEPSYVFGGVRHSVEVGVGGVAGGTMFLCTSPFFLIVPPMSALTAGTGAGLFACGVVSLINVPFSLAGDVVTLPLALHREQEAHRLADKARAAQAALPPPPPAETPRTPAEAPKPVEPPKIEQPAPTPAAPVIATTAPAAKPK